MNWSIFDYNFDKTFYTLHTEKVQHPRDRSVKTELNVSGTFGGTFRVICGSELQYIGKDRTEVDAVIAKLRKEISE